MEKKELKMELIEAIMDANEEKNMAEARMEANLLYSVYEKKFDNEIFNANIYELINTYDIVPDLNIPNRLALASGFSYASQYYIDNGIKPDENSIDIIKNKYYEQNNTNDNEEYVTLGIKEYVKTINQIKGRVLK